MVDVILDLGSDVIQKDESDDATIILDREKKRSEKRRESFDRFEKNPRIESERVKIESRKRSEGFVKLMTHDASHYLCKKSVNILYFQLS